MSLTTGARLARFEREARLLAVVVSLDTGQWTRVTSGIWSARYTLSPGGGVTPFLQNWFEELTAKGPTRPSPGSRRSASPPGPVP